MSAPQGGAWRELVQDDKPSSGGMAGVARVSLRGLRRGGEVLRRRRQIAQVQAEAAGALRLGAEVQAEAAGSRDMGAHH